MGIESSFMGEEPKIQPLIKKLVRKRKEAIDVISFGMTDISIHISITHELSRVSKNLT